MRTFWYSWLGLVAVFVFVGAASAASLFQNGSSGGAALIQIRGNPDDQVRTRSSLFADRNGGSLFEPIIRNVAPRDEGGWISLNEPGVAGLRDLIAHAEAGPAGYNAVVFNARIKPPKPPTSMTIDEIFRWIKDTPGQNHAIGRYQFIPSTLRRLVTILGVPGSARFTPTLQNELAHVLLEDAGLNAFTAGQMTQTQFMNNLAKIWAGLPTSSGKSHYHGYAGNKATMSWTRFSKEMSRIFPG